MADIDKLKAAFLAAHKAGDTEGARKLAAAIRQSQSPPAVDGPPPTAPDAEEPGFFAKAADLVTGNLRETPETESAPDWAGMPEMNQLTSIPGWKAAIGTMMTSPEETVKVLQSNFPGIQARQDEKGNFLLRSSMDGKEYAIKPGFQVSDIPRAAGAMMAFTPAGRATSVAGAGAASAGTQAVIEASQAATGGEFNPADVVLSGVTGAAIPAVVKTAGAAKSMLTPGATQAASPQAAAIANAESQGIKPLTSDVFPPGNFASKWVQTVGERIYGAGTGGVREAQQAQRVDAVRNLLRDFGADDVADAASDKVMADLAAKRGADLTKYSGLKGEVITRLDGAGVMPVSKATQEIDAQIASLQSLKSQDVAPVISMLDDFKQAIQGQGIANVERLRRQLGESLAANPALVAARSEGEKAARNIYRALNDDMGAHIKTAGQPRDFTKWAVANKRLSEMAGDVKTGTLRTVLAKGDATPEVVNKMLFSQKPSEIRQLYRGLSQNGKANARIAILQKAISDAGGIENVNPDRFATQVGELSRSVGVFFSGDELRQVQGLARALDMTRRAQQSAANPATGVQVAIPLGASILGDMFTSMGSGIAAAGGVGLTARAYESAPVRNLLVKIASVPRSSPEESALIGKLIPVVQAAVQAQQTQEPSNGR